jgi:hypothetical protein
MSQQNTGQPRFFYNGSTGIYPTPMPVAGGLDMIRTICPQNAVVTKIQWAKCRDTLLQHEFLIIHLLERKSGQVRRHSVAVVERLAGDKLHPSQPKAELVLNEETSESSKDKTTNAKSFFFFLKFLPLSHSTTRSAYSVINSSSSSPGYQAGDHFVFSYDGTDKFVDSLEGPHEVLVTMELAKYAWENNILFSDVLTASVAVNVTSPVYKLTNKNCYYFAHHVYMLLRDIGVTKRRTYREKHTKSSSMSLGKCNSVSVYTESKDRDKLKANSSKIDGKHEMLKVEMSGILAEIITNDVSTNFYLLSINQYWLY